MHSELNYPKDFRKRCIRTQWLVLESNLIKLRVGLPLLLCYCSAPHLLGWEIMVFLTITPVLLKSKILENIKIKKIKRRLLLGRKVITNLDSILKSRDMSLPTKVHLVKAMVFSVVMYGCESWTIKRAEQ